MPRGVNAAGRPRSSRLPLTRKTRLINVLDAGGDWKTQKDKGEPKAEGGGYTIAFEVPLYDFGKAKVREAEQRYFEAVNVLRALAVDARRKYKPLRNPKARLPG